MKVTVSRYEPGIETKKKIVDAGRKLFYEKGYENTSLADISELSGVRRNLIYYYFDNQERAKLEIGYIIYGEIIKKCFNEAGFYTADGDQVLLLANYIYWYKYFNDAKFRRFAVDACSKILVSDIFDNKDVYARYVAVSSHLEGYDNEPLNMAIKKGIDSQTMVYLDNHLSEFTYDYVTEYLFTLYDRIDNIKTRSSKAYKDARELMRKVRIDKLDFTFN